MKMAKFSLNFNHFNLLSQLYILNKFCVKMAKFND